MHDIYVDKQVTNLQVSYAIYISDIWLHYVNMRVNYVNMQNLYFNVLAIDNNVYMQVFFFITTCEITCLLT